ncbi:maleylpyruvate isomerase family mycothiol-dependent enzyme [Spirillospora sp. NBC_01491]|uniref:maleylpyruvate isomerase family mycothiol-dependent enzyme n=1 Tax=Spirillospora sp. NBC_01491 TaxID=2976007 RepID=UPI002E37C0AD|nr:maleylpyruvate isomerase family mycothiol-dependent enzyme [Spirillospora sp. NBC_01491]
MAVQPWDHDRYCDAAEVEIAAFAETVAAADLRAPVPTCPGWSMADLIRHLGGVYRWVGGMVRVVTPKRMGMRELGVSFSQGPDDLRPWFAEGGRSLAEALRAADPDATMWAWGEGGRAGFWPRRMLHETTVHRCDAELALGREPAVPAEVAVDGVDEVLTILRTAVAFAPKIENLRGDGEALAFTAPAAGARWIFTLLPDGYTWRREDAAGPGTRVQATVQGDAADLYLFLWGRRALGDPRLESSGDAALLARWSENSSI